MYSLSFATESVMLLVTRHSFNAQDWNRVSTGTQHLVMENALLTWQWNAHLLKGKLIIRALQEEMMPHHQHRNHTGLRTKLNWGFHSPGHKTSGTQSHSPKACEVRHTSYFREEKESSTLGAATVTLVTSPCKWGAQGTGSASSSSRHCPQHLVDNVHNIGITYANSLLLFSQGSPREQITEKSHAYNSTSTCSIKTGALVLKKPPFKRHLSLKLDSRRAYRLPLAHAPVSHMLSCDS